MTSQSKQPHFVLFPFLAQGHMIPLFDFGRLLASRGVKVTLVTTPANASRFASVIDRSIGSGLDIQLVEIDFPATKLGLPEGCENFDMIPSPEMTTIFFEAMEFLRQPVEELFERLEPRPHCVISDAFLPFTNDVANKFGVPRIMFNVMGIIWALGLMNPSTYEDHKKACSDTEKLVIQGLPDKLEFTRQQIPMPRDQRNAEFFKKVGETAAASYGVLLNSFRELAPAYMEAYKEVRGDKVWAIGPVSSYNKDNADKAERGNKSVTDANECIEWLNKREKGSVLYVCLGSLCNLKADQLKELAIGLEESRRPFIWVLRANYNLQELHNWIEEVGYEEKVAHRGFLIRGWSPQVLIQSHPSVGGFLTHCGWNSTLEGISAGLPLLTWPLFADHFFNEKLVVEVVKTGVSIGEEVTIGWGLEESPSGVKVTREDVRKGVEKLLNEGDDAAERRRRAKYFGEWSKKAMDEGGSSYVDLNLFITDIMEKWTTRNEEIIIKREKLGDE